MPKRNDFHTILLIGSGPIIIGQACEFDYSGTQAAKTLKKLGYRVVLINSNPATIMTDTEFAHRTYIEPITEEVITNIIKLEKIDAILPTMGGQTALNVAMSMYEKGLLEGIKFLGAKPSAIKKGEDRQAFKEAMIKLGMDLPKSYYAYNEEDALKAAKEIGFPLIIRASYTLAGGGSGVAYNLDEFKELARNGLDISPINEILIEESLLGWKEFEMEVIRDCKDNCIIVCSIENLDPMGVHTGDSITIAPALTLTDKEYQRMRDASFAILREIGVDTGGSNVQFAINPANGRMTVIEMNPRVSRSSALASKATGYPIAKVATMLAVGFSLDEIQNDITLMPASFEPSIDYIVTKIPRFTFEKFPNADSTLTTSMKSIGEVMAIGSSFKESLQKALCSLETGIFGFDKMTLELEHLKAEIMRPNVNRILYIAQGFRQGIGIEEMYELCKIDRFFLHQIKEIIKLEENINTDILQDAKLLRQVKAAGFSDKMIATLINEKENAGLIELEVYNARQRLGIRREYMKVDTCAGEFKANTNYLYSSIGNYVDDIDVSFLSLDSVKEGDMRYVSEGERKDKKILIIGGGPNRIGQGIEFDYCCVHASFALKDMGVKSIMYNCNPETVSTDYDTSDSLYFEPITFEYIRDVLEREAPDGIIVHFGGQTPLKLAKAINLLGGKIIGTSAKVIDVAEDREKFSAFVEENNILQAKNVFACTKEEAYIKASKLGFPILVRPSYVLGGRAMRIIYDVEELKIYMDEAVNVSESSPVLLDQFLEGAIELDMDCVSDGKDVYIGGIMEHIEEAGIHSGDSASCLPPFSLSAEMIGKIEKLSVKIALKLGVVGLMNVQYAIYKDELYLIEVNPRASRTVPFISKATNVPLAKIATRVMYQGDIKEALGFYAPKAKFCFYDYIELAAELGFIPRIYKLESIKHVAIKESVFPFNKLDGADMNLGPEMKSTGEVMGISNTLGLSFLKSQIASKNFIVRSGLIFISLKNHDKKEGVNISKKLIDLGFRICATKGTYDALSAAGVNVSLVNKVSQGRPNIIDHIKNHEISMVINTSDSNSNHGDTAQIRLQILKSNIPYFTTLSAAKMAILSIVAMQNGNTNDVKALQEYV